MDFDRINEFRKIFVLQTIVEEGSFRQAARKLGVTPSAISQSVSSLEKSLGKNLVIRDKNKVRLTAEAEGLLSKANPAFDVINTILGREEKKLKINRLDLGSFESLAIDILPKFLEHLRSDHPGVKLNLVVSRTSVLLQKLRSGELCTALVVDSEDLGNFKKEVLFEDELGLFIAKDSAYNDDVFAANEKLGLGVISPGQNGYPRYMQKFVNSLGKNFKASILSDSFEVLRNATVNGTILSVLPKKLAQRNSNQLLEVTHLLKRENEENGSHQVVLAYLEKCDHEEAIYLANIIKKYF